MTDSSHADISDSICQWLTKELTGLARVSTNVALARQFDSVDLVQMTWQSVLRNHRSVLRSWKRDRIRAFLRGIMVNKLRQVHRDYLDVEKRDMRRELQLELDIDSDNQSNQLLQQHDSRECRSQSHVVFVQKMLIELEGAEREVLVLKLKGFSNAQISSSLGLHRRSVQKAIQRIRTRFENRWRNN